jgi:hypothetical protein
MDNFILWVAILCLLLIWVLPAMYRAYVCGWTYLARKYKAEVPSNVNLIWLLTTFFYPGRNMFFLRLGFSEEGIYMVAPFWYRWSHPTLLVPWREIPEVHDATTYGLLKTHCFYIRTTEDGRFMRMAVESRQLARNQIEIPPSVIVKKDAVAW